MFDERKQYTEADHKGVPVPQFMLGFPFYPLYFGEDPGHVTDDFGSDEYIDKLTR
jgi:hypothetical protein